MTMANMEAHRVDPMGSVVEQIEELSPKSMDDFRKLYNEVYDNCTETLYMDEVGQVWARGMYIAKCKV